MSKLIRNLISGVSSVMDISPARTEPGRNPAQHILRRSDAEAIREDWMTVGGDLRGALEEYGDVQQVEKQSTLETVCAGS